MELVAFVGKDRENWGQVNALIKREKWDKVILVRNKDASGFISENTESIEIDSSLPIVELKEMLISELKKKLSKEFEVSLSIASGNGKEHMTLISALLSIPVGVRLAVFTKKGVDYLT